MNANTAKALFGGLLPFITNPATLAIIGIGAVGITVYGMLSDEKEDKDEEDSQSDNVPNGSEPCQQPLNRTYLAVPATVNEQLETVEATVIETVETKAEEPFIPDGYGGDHDSSDELDASSEEATKKEVIRQAMSELGKRSGEARRKKSQTKLDVNKSH